MAEDIWIEDRLNRSQEAKLLRRFIENQCEFRSRKGDARTFVLNLDSAWGGGKTFFLKRMAAEIDESGHIAVYVNAWESDFLEDPLVAVFTDIREKFEKFAKDNGIEEAIRERVAPLKSRVGKIAAKAATGAAKQVIRKVVGEEDGVEIAEAFGLGVVDGIGEQVVDAFEEKKKTVEEFRKDLELLVEATAKVSGEASLAFILIDELDRCRPNYSVLLLERIKHLFSVDGVVFVVATDTSQLSNAVSGIYGSSFDGSRYLRRFFDRTYRFLPSSRTDFIKERFEALGLSESDFEVPPEQSCYKFLDDAFSVCDSSLRDIEQMLSILQTFRAVWPYQELKIVLPFLLPKIYRRFSNMTEDSENPMFQQKIPLVYYDRINRVRKNDPVSLEQFANKVDFYAMDLFSEKLYNPKDALGVWIGNIFHNEQSLLHNNSFNQMSRPQSVLSEYESFLNQVSSFSNIE